MVGRISLYARLMHKTKLEVIAAKEEDLCSDLHCCSLVECTQTRKEGPAEIKRVHLVSTSGQPL
jgi:hypothetical protein